MTFTSYTQDKPTVIFKHNNGWDILIKGPITASYNLKTGEINASEMKVLMVNNRRSLFYPQQLNNAYEIYNQLLDEYELRDHGPIERFADEREPNAFSYRDDEPQEYQNVNN